MTEEEFRAHIAQNRRDAMAAARFFTQACIDGDGDSLRYAAEGLFNTVDGWRLAMRGVGRLPRVSQEVRAAFLSVWIESKMLPLRVGHRPTLAAALRVLMPRNYDGDPLPLFRGTGPNERSRRLYGFSWTTCVDVARSFATGRSESGFDAIVLATVAPPEAILLVREDEGYYDEGEVVVDPFSLGQVTVSGRIAAVARLAPARA